MKKIISSFMAILLILFTMTLYSPISAFEDHVRPEGGEYDVWDGSVDTYWYTSDPSLEIYHIHTSSELAGLAKLVNSGVFPKTGVTVSLSGDLDLNGIEWTPIGGSNKLTNVTFNGNGKVIKGLKIHTDTYNQKGLFGWVVNSNFNNIIVLDADIRSGNGGYVGILVADTISTSIFQSYTSGTITITGGIADAVGGLMGQYFSNTDGQHGYIRESASSAKIVSDLPGQYGGLLGWGSTYNDSIFEISDSYFSGELIIGDGNSATNGIAGIMVAIRGFGFPSEPSGEHIIKNVYVSGTVENMGDHDSALGIALIDGTVDSAYWPSELGIEGIMQQEWDSVNGVFIPGTGETINSAELSFSEMKIQAFLDKLNDGRDAWRFLSNDVKNQLPLLTWQLYYFDADYTQVESVIGTIPTDFERYTDASWQALQDAIAGVEYALKANEQGVVDSYATSIQSAIDALVVKQFKVSLSLIDGTIDSQTLINYSALMPIPTDPTREGYAFAGWYTEDTLTEEFDFNTPILSDITLYAKWTKNAEPPKPGLPETGVQVDNTPYMVTVLGAMLMFISRRKKSQI